jgi:LCP family protein required for cell wall assembly
MADKLLTSSRRGRRVKVHRARRSMAFGPGTKGRRWPKRLLIGTGSLVMVLVLLIAGVFIYVHITLDKLHKTHVAGLTPSVPGKPFDILLVGSDSRAFVDSTGEADEFGSAQSQTGQRSDVIIVARVAPATHQVKLLSIPRDTYVDIPGDIQYVSGPNKINVAYNSGPSLLVQTIEQSFHIPITYYVSLDFPAFEGMVNALGGIYLDFPYPARDPDSGLDISTAGCQLVDGVQALALVRSRHFYYYADGAWQYDGLSDLSRIRRQDAFFTAVLDRVKASLSLTGLPTLNSFISAASTGLTIDQTLSEGEMLSLARMFHSTGSSALQTETLPTSPYEISNGEDVLLPVVGPDEQAISQFLAFGTQAQTTSAVGSGAGSATSAAQATTAPLRADGASAHPGFAALGSTSSRIGSSLRQVGGGRAPALDDYVRSASTSSPPTTSPTVNTVAGTPVITDPAEIDYNTQPEPWNPVACTSCPCTP